MAIPYSLWPALTSVSSLHVTDTDPALTDTEPTGAVPLIIIVPVLVSMASSLVAGAGGYALVSCARDSTARSDQPTTTASISSTMITKPPRKTKATVAILINGSVVVFISFDFSTGAGRDNRRRVWCKPCEKDFQAASFKWLMRKTAPLGSLGRH